MFLDGAPQVNVPFSLDASNFDIHTMRLLAFSRMDWSTASFAAHLAANCSVTSRSIGIRVFREE